MRLGEDRGPRRATAVAAVVAGLAAAAVATLPAQGQAYVNPPRQFDHQAIAWHDCRTNPHDPIGGQLAAVGAVCGEMTVPLDYRHPDGRTISVAVDRRPASDPVHRLGTLFVNTGGIDASRVAIPLLVQGGEALGAQYDLVAFDPRFFGLSEPLNCGWPHGLQSTANNTATPDRASFTAQVARARELASLCAKDADVLPFVSTRDIARDMDVLRGSLGERRVSYLGWSYGGYLGAVFVQMFGQHVDRVVLDSAPSPDNYGPLEDRDNESAATRAAQANWAGWAAQRDGQYHLGASTRAVLTTVTGIIDAARRQPLRVGDFTVDANILPGLLEPAVESDGYYAGLAADVAVLRDAANGLPVTPTRSLTSLLRDLADRTVHPTDHVSANIANRCADRAAPRDPEFYYRDIQAHLATEPIYGPLFRTIHACAFWPTNPIEPPTTVDSRHPVLIVGGTGDPDVPFADQLVMHRALHGSRMVTLDDSFNHGQFLNVHNACVDTVVQAYLLGGPLPAHDLSCQFTSS